MSELKKRSYEEEFLIPKIFAESEEQKSKELMVGKDLEITPIIPRFIEKKTEEITGAARGTAYHRVMECLEYSKVQSVHELEEQVKALVDSGKMTKEEAVCVRISDLEIFVESDLGKRMKEAAGCGMLFREQPFMIAKPASEIQKGWPEEERVLVQGTLMPISGRTGYCSGRL